MEQARPASGRTPPCGGQNEAPRNPPVPGGLLEGAAPPPVPALRDGADMMRSWEAVTRATDVISYQFDLEILFRFRELRAIQEELDRGKELLRELRSLILQGEWAATETGPALATRKSRLANPYGGTRPGSAPAGPSKSAPNPEDLVLYSRKNDGTYVRMKCPKCDRSNFLNQQGFINHCRHSHRIKFSSHEEAKRVAGVPVDESEVPPDHPCRSQEVLEYMVKVKALKEEGPKPLLRPEIKEYDEDVEIADSVPDVVKEDGKADTSRPVSPRKRQRMESADSAGDAIPTGPPEFETSLARNPAGEAVLIDESYDHSVRAIDNKPSAHPEAAVETAARERRSPPPAPVYHAATDTGSRFHVKRSVIIGNVSRYIPPDKRSPDMAEKSHQWMMYVDCPPGDPPIGSFVRRVRFYLHASYRPHDVVDVVDPPFHLVRYGWGEFPVRARLFFADSERNRPVDLYHQLTSSDAPNPGSSTTAIPAARFAVPSKPSASSWTETRKRGHPMNRPPGEFIVDGRRSVKPCRAFLIKKHGSPPYPVAAT